MADHPSFALSDQARIRLVRDGLALWMNNNKFALYEVNRAIAMLLREDDERRIQAMQERRSH
jgi:hypothetical protein